MKRLETFSRHAVLAASLGLAAGSAHAVPIVFDFSGAVQGTSMVHSDGSVTNDDSLSGLLVTGRITVESDGLLFNSSSQVLGSSITYTDAIMDPAHLITSELVIGGVSYDIGLYSGHHGALSAFDSTGVPVCVGCPYSPDQILLSDVSMEYWLRDGAGAPFPPAGEYPMRSLGLTWVNPNDQLGLVDLSNGFQPLDVISWVAGLLPRGYYNEYTMDCADGGCLSTTISSTNFSITSLTASAANIPEPGTLALFAVGLLGTGLARRGRSAR